MRTYPDSKAHVANVGPIWGRQDPGGPHAGPMNLVIRVHSTEKQWVQLLTHALNSHINK